MPFRINYYVVIHYPAYSVGAGDLHLPQDLTAVIHFSYIEITLKYVFLYIAILRYSIASTV